MRQPRLSQPLLLVVAELLTVPKPGTHGYDLMRSTGVPAGTLYPLLVRLTDAGWLTASWEARAAGGRPPRHLYKMTAEGRRQAQQLLSRAAAVGWKVPIRESS